MFEKIFQYELNNRAFAYISVTSLAEKMAETEQADFWHAYARMEQLSQPRYQKASEKYGLKVNSFLVKLKVWGTDLAFMLFPKKMLSIMTDATHAYVEKLKPLPDLARLEDREFFEYVVAQEQAQAHALTHAVGERYDLAAFTINEFLASQMIKDRE